MKESEDVAGKEDQTSSDNSDICDSLRGHILHPSSAVREWKLIKDD